MCKSKRVHGRDCNVHVRTQIVSRGRKWRVETGRNPSGKRGAARRKSAAKYASVGKRHGRGSRVVETSAATDTR